MSMKNLLMLLTFVLGINVAYAAGEPMNQDFTGLIKATSAAIDIGKQGKNNEFLTALESALEIAKEQKLNGDSPKLQKVGAKLKTAKKLAKEGNNQEATQAAEEALSVIK